MLPLDLTRDITTRLKSIAGQISGIIGMPGKDDNPVFGIRGRIGIFRPRCISSAAYGVIPKQGQ